MSSVRIITPIITAGFRNDEKLYAAIPAGCELSSMFIKNGPASVESAVDEVLAAPGVVEAALTAEAEGAEALVIDCMLDPGLDAAREAVSIPVMGCGETALRAAASFGAFSVVTVLQRQARAFHELASRYAIVENLKSVRGIGVSVLDLERETEKAVKATIEQSRAAANEDGAHTIVFGCTGMLGFGDPVAIALGELVTRVFDPLPFAVAQAHAAAQSGEKSDKDSYPSPEPKTIRGFSDWPAIEKLMAGER
jgi:allantoin racemase